MAESGSESGIMGALSSGGAGGGRMGGMGFGAVQLGMGLMNRKKADAMLPTAQSPEERQIYNVYRRRRRALETGTAGFLDKKLVGQNVKQYGQNAFRAGGPVNTGVLAQLMNQGMKNISDQYGQQYSEAMKGEGDFATKKGDIERDTSFLRSARKSAQGEQQVQAGQQNILASMPSREQMASILKALIPGGSAV